MITVTKAAYDAIHPDYKGVWKDTDGKHPEWNGRRSCFLGCIQKDGGTKLAIEGIDFNFIEPAKWTSRPTLSWAAAMTDLTQDEKLWAFRVATNRFEVPNPLARTRSVRFDRRPACRTMAPQGLAIILFWPHRAFAAASREDNRTCLTKTLPGRN